MNVIIVFAGMVNVVFQSVFRVAYEKTHFSVFVIEEATVFEYPVKLFILSVFGDLV